MADVSWWLGPDAAVRVSEAPVLQVAANGAWETALVADCGRASEASDLVAQGLAATRADVAVEVLWPGQGFVGARWLLEEAPGAGAAAARAAVLATRTGQHDQPMAEALAALLDAAPGRDVDRIELGALNAWASVGAQVLWQRGRPDATVPLDELRDRRPDLFECRHPVALEIAGSEPRGCWVGVVVSTPYQQLHRLDLTRARQLYDQVAIRPS